jgi:hypothetical protein
MDENKKEPVIGGMTNSVLDNSSIVDDINQEQVAEPIEKPNAAKLLFNKNNRLLLFSLIGISVIGLASILYAFASIEQETNKKPPVIQKNDGELPIGEQTEARAKEIDLYNQKKSNGVVQPIALENVSNKSTQDLDFDVETKEPNIDEISGCSLSDTACMRIKKRISPDECAPKDAVCLAVLESRKEKDSAHEKVELSEHDKYLERLKDPEYSKQIAELIKKTADSKKEMFVENGAIIDYPEPVVEPEKNKETSSDIEGGILSKSTEDIIKLMDSGDRLMGAAEIALNSKIEGEASFSVFGGEFVETRMLGQVKRQDE